ncbi:MAG: disulfide bond formation protein B [Pseudomonadota bacterium]
MQKLLDQPRLLPCFILLACLVIVGVAYSSQVFGGLKPCVLCIYQRYAYGVAGFWGLMGLAFRPMVGWRRLCIALAGLSFLAGMGLAIFHVGVEHLWWEGTPGCHAPQFDPNASIDELREQLLNTDFVACDQVAWSLFGISMAGYNAMVSGVLGLFCLWAANRMKGQQPA